MIQSVSAFSRLPMAKPAQPRFGCDKCACGVNNPPAKNADGTTATTQQPAEHHSLGAHLTHHAHCIGAGLVGGAALLTAFLLMRKKKGA